MAPHSQPVTLIEISQAISFLAETETAEVIAPSHPDDVAQSFLKPTRVPYISVAEMSQIKPAWHSCVCVCLPV